MKYFSELIQRIDSTTKTNPKVDALAWYFSQADDAGKIWAIALLSGKRPRRTVNTTLLRAWAAEASGLPSWLFEESYHIVGDLAETIAILLPQGKKRNPQSLDYWLKTLISLRDKDESEKKHVILEAWSQMSRRERFVFNKLITGGMRIGVSQKLMVKGLSKYTGIDENELAFRIMGDWDPVKKSFTDLILSENAAADLSKPYPFYLAYALEDEPNNLGDIDEWQVERKWDGIRGQLIVRKEEIAIWSRGEELVTEKYPELKALKDILPDGTVIDGELICHNGQHPLAFNLLQTRIGRKKVSKKLMDEAPVSLIAYDLLEKDGSDVRSFPLQERRKWLEEIVLKCSFDRLLLSEIVWAENWEKLQNERAKSRELMCEGLMLKRKNSEYKVGRKRGDWWKWKIDAMTIDAVMIYAMRGHGRRANLYTDYTFAVWDGDTLVPFAKAYSGLTDKEFREVDAFVKRNTLDRFGPVRAVKPNLVFEIAFEGIQKSKRHKSGIALRFPRMHRWRKDKHPKEANTLEELKALLIDG